MYAGSHDRRRSSTMNRSRHKTARRNAHRPTWSQSGFTQMRRDYPQLPREKAGAFAPAGFTLFPQDPDVGGCCCTWFSCSVCSLSVDPVVGFPCGVLPCWCTFRVPDTFTLYVATMNRPSMLTVPFFGRIPVVLAVLPVGCSRFRPFLPFGYM